MPWLVQYRWYKYLYEYEYPMVFTTVVVNSIIDYMHVLYDCQIGILSYLSKTAFGYFGICFTTENKVSVQQHTSHDNKLQSMSLFLLLVRYGHGGKCLRFHSQQDSTTICLYVLAYTPYSMSG